MEGHDVARAGHEVLQPDADDGGQKRCVAGVRKMKENPRKDTETAKASMKRSGDDVRLAGLKNKKRPDL